MKDNGGALIDSQGWQRFSQDVRWFTVGSPRWVERALGCNSSTLDMRTVNVGSYPDGEIKISLGAPPAATTVIASRVDSERTRRFDVGRLCALHAACLAARQHGADRVIAMLPEIPYLRQDRSRPGHRELTARDWIVALLDLPVLDAVVTWQPKPGLSTLLRRTQVSVPTPGEITAAIRAALRDGEVAVDVVVAPDAGAQEMATVVAAQIGVPALGMHKRRLGADEVEVSAAAGMSRGKHCLLVDDMYVSGGTLLAAATELRQDTQSIACYIGNFRPTPLGRERLRHMLDNVLVDRMLVPRYDIPDRSDHRILPVDTAPGMRSALRQALQPSTGVTELKGLHG